MGAYTVTGIWNRKTFSLASNADMEEAETIAQGISAQGFDEVQIKQVNNIIIRKYAKGELVER